ncbi:hypothetical protein JCM16814_11620 [Desulfobaculum senezii]
MTRVRTLSHHRGAFCPEALFRKCPEYDTFHFGPFFASREATREFKQYGLHGIANTQAKDGVKWQYGKK